MDPDATNLLHNLGMEIFMYNEFLNLSMEKYIEQALDVLGLADIRPAKSPINAPIEGGLYLITHFTTSS